MIQTGSAINFVGSIDDVVFISACKPDNDCTETGTPDFTMTGTIANIESNRGPHRSEYPWLVWIGGPVAFRVEAGDPPGYVGALDDTVTVSVCKS